MNTFYLNPLYLFGFAFVSVIVLYSLKLSGLYVNGSWLLTIIMIQISLVSICVGVIFKSAFNNALKGEIDDEWKNKILWPNAMFIVFGFIIECYASGTVPLLSIVTGADYSYKDFGLKTFHVFYMGYMSAFSIVNFERYVKTKKRKFLFYSLLGIAVTLLIVSRGAMMLLIIPMTLLYLSKRKVNRSSGLKTKIYMLLGVFLVIYLFGYLGDKRMISSGYKSDTAIYEIGMANELFNPIPSGFFWVYLYATSPYGTLAAQEKYDNVDKGGISDLISSSILPDFISKYTSPGITSNFFPRRLTPELTVPTGFGLSLVTYGYVGIILVFIYYVTLSFVCAWLNRNKYICSTCAIIAAAGILMTFDNMLIFSSCVMQLIVISLFSRFHIGRYYFI